MNYNEFLETIEVGLRTKLGEDIKIDTSQILKNNTKKDVMVIRVEQEVITPCISLESLYAMYQLGEHLEVIIDKIVAIVKTNSDIKSLDISKIKEWDYARNLVEARIINTENNVELLSKIPHQIFLDCAVVYYINADDWVVSDCHASIKVTNENLDIWGVSIEELDMYARNNYLKKGTTFQSMEEVLSDMLEVDIEDNTAEEGNRSMYVLANKERQYGAIAMRDKEVLQSIHEKLEGEFYILPSSIHELIIVPCKMAVEVQELQEMVRTINETEVSAEEVLSNSIYYYDGEQVCMVA